MDTKLLQIVSLFALTIILVNAAVILVYYNTGKSTEFNQLMNEYRSLFSNYTSLNQSFINSLDIIQQLRMELFSLNSTYISTKQSCEQTISNLTEKISALNSENEGLFSNLTTTQIELNMTKNQLANLQNNFTKLLLNYSALNQSYFSLLNNYNALMSTYLQLGAKLSEISNSLSLISNLTTLRGMITQSSSSYIDYNSQPIVEAIKQLFGSNKENPYTAEYKIYNFIKSNITFNYPLPYNVITYNPTDGTVSYKEDAFYLRSASEVMTSGIGDGKDEAIVFASMLENFYLTYWGGAPNIYVVILNGTGIHGYRYHGFLLVLYGKGKASLFDPAASQIMGQDYTELVQADPTDIYGAVSSYIARINSYIGTYNNVVGMIGVNNVYYLNNTDIKGFINFLYSIGS
ncbi:MAG: hypothetical protein JHC28_04135 [Thermoprotei archaeon]|nr:hypothetical protein [Thermoprotei archaeon]